jgi:hypothetical protein
MSTTEYTCHFPKCEREASENWTACVRHHSDGMNRELYESMHADHRGRDGHLAEIDSLNREVAAEQELDAARRH